MCLARLRALCASVALGGSLSAQAQAGPTLEGRVVREDSVAVSGATIRLMQGATVRVTRSDDLGRYRIAGMADGSWTVSVQAVGHIAIFERLTYAGPASSRDFVLKRVQTELAPVFVEGNWSGVRGFVVDERGIAPLAGARIEVISQGGEVHTTDTSGRFTIEKPDGNAVRLLVEREGYARRVVMAQATRLASERLVIRLDTVWDPVKDWVEWQDLRGRMRQASPLAAFVSGDEIREVENARFLDAALNASPSIVSKGVAAGGCYFLNGVPKPGMTWWDIDKRLVDFVEVYPAGTEHSGTLALRWGSKGGCGDDRATVSRRPIAAYIVIWLETPPPPPRPSQSPP